MVKFCFTRQLSCTYHSVFMNWPCASGWPSDSWYWVIAPSSALANPTLVLSGFDPSVLNVSVPL